MDYLPKDPAILVSSVNMLLRDEEFDTLEALCFAFTAHDAIGNIANKNACQYRPSREICNML